MKDVFDINNDIRSLVDVAEVQGILDGGIWTMQMPDNHKKTAVVINTLTGTNDQIQQAVVNVRIHTPNIQVWIEKQYSSIPDQRTLKKVSDLLIPLLDSKYMPSFWTEVVKPAYLFKDNDGSHFTLIQVNYYSIQDHYKNI
jgi:hypothetical protein